MSSAITLATIFGTKVRMHLTFPILLLWVAAVEALTRGAGAALIGVIFVMMLFVCVIAHEFGHILVARHYGGRTRDILLLPIGGVSRMDRMPEGASEELAVALAGPIVSIAIGLILILLVGFPTAKSIQSPELSALIPRLAAANLFLAFFNLMPAFPMDGGRALRAALSMKVGRVRATRLAAHLGHAFGLLLGTFGLMSGNPIILLIGVFIYIGASAEAANTELEEQARSLTVSDVMRTNVSSLESGAPLTAAVDLMLHAGQSVIPVTDLNGKYLGIVTKDGVIRALDRFGKDARMADVVETGVAILSAENKLSDAIARMRGNAVPAVIVVHPRGELAGILTSETLADLMLVHAAQELSTIRQEMSKPPLTVSVPKSL
jgi:stage IV sporulation protein FB